MTEVTETQTAETKASGATAATREVAKFHVITKDGNYHIFDTKRDVATHASNVGIEQIHTVIKGHQLQLAHKQIVSIC